MSLNNLLYGVFLVKSQAGLKYAALNAPKQRNIRKSEMLSAFGDLFFFFGGIESEYNNII